MSNHILNNCLTTGLAMCKSDEQSEEDQDSNPILNRIGVAGPNRLVSSET